MNLADGVLLAQVDEALFQVDIFTGQDGGGALRRDVLQHLGVLPRNHVLHPRQVVFLVRLAQADDGVHAQVAEVVHRERNLHADRVAHRRHVFAQLLDSLVRHLHRGERMRQSTPLPGAHPRGTRHGVGDFRHHLDAQVHLQPREAHLFFAGLQALREDLGVFRFGGVGVDPDLVAEFAAQHLVDRHAVHFAGDVPERFFDWRPRRPPAARDTPNCLIF